jgi:hypothetical protein
MPGDVFRRRRGRGRREEGAGGALGLKEGMKYANVKIC